MLDKSVESPEIPRVEHKYLIFQKGIELILLGCFKVILYLSRNQQDPSLVAVEALSYSFNQDTGGQTFSDG